MKNTTNEKWKSDVLDSKDPVLVDFWAEWCGPCRLVAPIFEDLSEEFNGKVGFVKVNVDKEQKLAQKYNISSIPTLALFKNGKILQSKTGATSKENIKKFIEMNLN